MINLLVVYPSPHISRALKKIVGTIKKYFDFSVQVNGSGGLVSYCVQVYKRNSVRRLMLNSIRRQNVSVREKEKEREREKRERERKTDRQR